MEDGRGMKIKTGMAAKFKGEGCRERDIEESNIKLKHPENKI